MNPNRSIVNGEECRRLQFYSLDYKLERKFLSVKYPNVCLRKVINVSIKDIVSISLGGKNYENSEPE